MCSILSDVLLLIYALLIKYKYNSNVFEVVFEV